MSTTQTTREITGSHVSQHPYLASAEILAEGQDPQDSKPTQRPGSTEQQGVAPVRHPNGQDPQDQN